MVTTQRLTMFAVFGLTCFWAAPSSSQTVEWIRQFGTPEFESTASVSADVLGNVFVSGRTYGNFGGPPPASPSAYLRKYTASGVMVWTRQVGPLELNNRAVVAADGLGNAYLVGETTGNIAGVNAGLTDIFLRKYDSAGGVTWTKQIGGSSYDVPRDVVADGVGNFYATGFTASNFAGSALGSYDAFLMKYDSSGNQIWARQFGTDKQDDAEGVAIDGLGNVYVSGYTAGSFGGPFAGGSYDMFLAKYDADGNALWKRQLGTSSWDTAREVAADALGNVYLAGYTEGVLGAGAVGGGDIAVTKFDAAGNVVWTRQFGTTKQDISFGAAADGFGNVYLGGTTGGDFGGPTAGPHDGFALKFLADGTLGWVYQIGSKEQEFGQSLAHDGSGDVYFAGTTQGIVGAASAGGEDTFLVKLTDETFAPEPSSFTILGLAILLAPRWRCARRRISTGDACR